MNLKKIGKVFTSKFVGIGPSSYKKNNLPGRGLTKVENHLTRECEDNYSRAVEDITVFYGLETSAGACINKQ
jgi:hypothetical protein